jgi:predicted aspartyl protease
VEEEEVFQEEEVEAEETLSREVTPHISLDALEGTVGLNTMKVNGKMDKTTMCILIDSGSTHNFLNTVVVRKLQYQLTPIKPMTVQAANGDKMVFKSMCKGL